MVNIKEARPVEAALDALPNKLFKGHVLSIGSNFSEKQGDIICEATILLTDKGPFMGWGMTAEVKFKW